VADNVELVGASGNFFGASVEAPFSGDTVKLLLLARSDYAGAEGARTLIELHDKYSRSDTFTGTGNGTTVDVSGQALSGFGIQVKGTGAPAAAWNVVLEGSLDNTNFTTIATHSNLTDSDGKAKPGGGAPWLYFRSRCVSLTLGSATNIVVTILGVPSASARTVSLIETDGTDTALKAWLDAMGDCSFHHVVTAASKNPVVIKASSARLRSVHGFNNAGYPVKVCFHNSASSPTAGSGVVASFVCQSGRELAVRLPGKGQQFTTGLAMTIVAVLAATDMADTGATDTVLNDAAFEVGYV
jgi:hypothetical protein